MQQVVQSIDESDGNCWDCTFSVKWQKMARLKQQKMPKALKKGLLFFYVFMIMLQNYVMFFHWKLSKIF